MPFIEQRCRLFVLSFVPTYLSAFCLPLYIEGAGGGAAQSWVENWVEIGRGAKKWNIGGGEAGKVGEMRVQAGSVGAFPMFKLAFLHH